MYVYSLALDTIWKQRKLEKNCQNMTKDGTIHGKVFQIHNVSRLWMTNTVLHKYLYAYMLTEKKTSVLGEIKKIYVYSQS